MATARTNWKAKYEAMSADYESMKRMNEKLDREVKAIDKSLDKEKYKLENISRIIAEISSTSLFNPEKDDFGNFVTGYKDPINPENAIIQLARVVGMAQAATTF